MENEIKINDIKTVKNDEIEILSVQKPKTEKFENNKSNIAQAIVFSTLSVIGTVFYLSVQILNFSWFYTSTIFLILIFIGYKKFFSES